MLLMPRDIHDSSTNVQIVIVVLWMDNFVETRVKWNALWT